MHFRVPKPLHGWSEFLHEIGIVVIGILIALILNQIVEQLGWSRKAAAAQGSIAKELALDAGVLDERRIEAACLRNTLGQLHNVIADARRTGRIGNLQGGVVMPLIRPLKTAAWEAAQSDGTATHLAESRREQFGLVYPILTEYRRDLDDEQRLWTHLRWLRASPGKLDASLLSEVSSASAELDYRDWLNSANAQQQLAVIRSLGIQPAYDLILDRPGTRGEVVKKDRAFGVAAPDCTPVTVDGKAVAADPGSVMG